MLFVLFGIGIMCLPPRSPEIEHNLGVGNGTFGTLVSLGAIGCIFSNLWVGQIAHRLGVRTILIASVTLMYAATATIPHIHTPWIYILAVIAIGFSWPSYQIGLNQQVLKRQNNTATLLLPKLHGAWSVGALTTVVAAFLLTSKVSLAWHIDVLAALVWSFTIFSIYKLNPVLITASDLADEPIVKTKELFAGMREIRPVIIALLLAISIESSTNDWATLSSHQEIHASNTLSIIPYLSFMVSMIIGRVSIHRLVKFRSERYWIRFGSLLGGLGFGICVLLAKFLSSHSFAAAFSIEVLGFFLGGLGSSFMAGLFMTEASRRSHLSPGMVAAQLGLAVNTIGFVVRLATAWIVQLTSITIGLMLPTALMLCLLFYKTLGNAEVTRD